VFSTRSEGTTVDVQLNGGTTIHGDIGNGSSWITTSADASYAYSAGTWYSVAYSVTPTGYSIYAQGANRAVGTYSSASPLLWNPTQGICISCANGIGFDLQEMRVSTVPISSQWYTTEYDNESSPSTFYTLGSEL